MHDVAFDVMVYVIHIKLICVKLYILYTLHNTLHTDDVKANFKRLTKGVIMAHNINQIVLTGGPCAGKTTALRYLNQYFQNDRRSLLLVPETATEMIKAGFDAESGSPEFERAFMQRQLAKEAAVQAQLAAARAVGQQVLVVYDRGLMDARPYISESDFQQIMDEFDTNEAEILARYDAVFHLVTAARGMAEHYQQHAGRRESPERAVAIDQLTWQAWENHPQHYRIDNQSSVDRKMACLATELTRVAPRLPRFLAQAGHVWDAVANDPVRYK
jgi:predicted ATPase